MCDGEEMVREEEYKEYKKRWWARRESVAAQEGSGWATEFLSHWVPRVP